MLTFIEMEFLKLKRSNIFLLSLMGAILPPFLMFIAVFAFDEGNTFELLFNNVNMYMSALFAILLFAIMTTFARFYQDPYHPPKYHSIRIDIKTITSSNHVLGIHEEWH